jgi:hypothetical protein
MVTISPAWDPSDPVAYRVGGLRGRIEHVKAAWRRIWELCRAPGAAAYVSVECSAGGHVHLPAIIYGAFRARAALARAAGCFVDVREAHGHSVREAIKYALKAPAPRGAWLAGESRETPHPALAAAWTVASRGRRLVEPFGLMRDALAAVDACEGGEGEGGEPAKREPPRCASCGSLELDAGRPALLRDVARECLALGRARWTTAARASPRGELSTAGAMVLPPRVVISFGGDHGGRKVAARGANRAVHG